MNKAKLKKMTATELVEFYNDYADKPVARFSSREVALRRCEALLDTSEESASRPAMVTSLKLDRRIMCLENSKNWPNAYQMWVENPAWMTSSQQDRLTAQLYAAAKEGKRIVVTVAGRRFRLISNKLKAA
jgi:hypothetical protein